MDAVKDEISQAIKGLPPFPEVVLKAIRVLKDQKTSAQEVVDIIQFDPGLTSNILRAANSAFYALPLKVASLKQAVTFLGSENVVNLLVMGGSLSYLRGRQAQYPLEGEALLTHSLTTALLCQALCSRVAISDPTTAFTAGLLHDIGKIILGTYVRDQFDDIHALVVEQDFSLLQAERVVLGIDHAMVGSAIAEQWHFPEVIRVPIAKHHELTSQTDEVGLVSSVVFLADRASIFIDGRLGADHWCFSDFKAAMNLCGLSEVVVDEALGVVRRGLPQVLAFIHS